MKLNNLVKHFDTIRHFDSAQCDAPLSAPLGSISHLVVLSQKKETIKQVKDLAAASVLVSSIIAFIIGVFVFFPKLVGLFL